MFPGNLIRERRDTQIVYRWLKQPNMVLNTPALDADCKT